MIAQDEWDTITMLIEEGWPGEFTDAAAASWRVFLDEYDAAQILAALKALVARGGTFRPSVAEVVAQVRDDPSKPTFDETVLLVKKALRAWNLPVTGNYGSETEMLRARHQNVLDRAAGMHPLVAAFVARYGVDRLQKDIGELGDGEWGGVRRQQLRTAWDEHCDALEGREIASITSGRRGEMARLDPLAVLGIGPPRQISSGNGA